MKKIISIILALTLVLSLSVAAFADGTNGTITINGASSETVYAVYRMLELESHDKGAGNYSYKIISGSPWTAFFTTGYGKDFVSIDASGYVTWIGAEDDTTMAAFAKEALKYAEANSIAPVADSDPTTTTIDSTYYTLTGTTGKFTNLTLGWYLVDSNAGALCALTTTDKDAVVNAKNKVPTIDKKVQEDLTGEYGESNTADIGQIVNFRTTITVAAGAQNYVMHDTMSDNFYFEHGAAGRGVLSVVVKHTGGTETTLTEGTDYTVLYKAADCRKTDCTHTGHALEDATCTFEIVFSANTVAKLLSTDAIIVDYNAMLNRFADVGNENDESTAYNPNESWLEYGEDHYTTHDSTETYTFSFDLVKTDNSNKLLTGAGFKIYDAAVGGNEIAVTPLYEADNTTPIVDAYGNQKYRRCKDGEPGSEILVTGGIVTIVGFDNGTYYLEETTVPDGYNKLAGRQAFSISNANSSATLDVVDGNKFFVPGPNGVHVVNKTGSMLPETGAAGTVLFITLGMFVVLATGVLLVTKKRMTMIRE